MKHWKRNQFFDLSPHAEYLGSSKCLPRPSTSNRPKSWLQDACRILDLGGCFSNSLRSKMAADPDPIRSSSCSKSTSLAVCDFTSSSSTPQDSATEPGAMWWSGGQVVSVSAGLLTQLSWHLVGQRKPWRVQVPGPSNRKTGEKSKANLVVETLRLFCFTAAI